MAKLTKSQLAFIQRMQLDSYSLFDASGLRARDWKLQMKELGKLVAFGVTPCSAGGHSLRTRAGHCLQCNTANLSFLKRMSDRGEVYVAWSSGAKLAKIGLSQNSYSRLESLNYFKYGGVSDWEMKLIYECDNAGTVEFEAHRQLSAFAKNGISYMNGNVERFCTEIFKCKLKQATDILEKVVNA